MRLRLPDIGDESGVPPAASSAPLPSARFEFHHLGSACALLMVDLRRCHQPKPRRRVGLRGCRQPVTRLRTANWSALPAAANSSASATSARATGDRLPIEYGLRLGAAWIRLTLAKSRAGRSECFHSGAALPALPDHAFRRKCFTAPADYKRGHGPAPRVEIAPAHTREERVRETRSLSAHAAGRNESMTSRYKPREFPKTVVGSGAGLRL